MIADRPLPQFGDRFHRPLLLVVLAAALMIGGCGPSYSFQELQDALDEIRSSDGIITKSAMFSKIGRPQSIQVIGSEVYLYYRVKEGTAQIVVRRGYWESEGPLHLLVKGAVEKEWLLPPDDWIKWYLDRGGINPFSIREDVIDAYHVNVVVLKDGKEVKTYSAIGEAYSSGPVCESCTVTHHLKGQIPPGDKNIVRAGRDYPSKEQPWPEGMAGYFAIRDKSSGAMLTPVKYFERRDLVPGTETYNRRLEEKREKAKKTGEAIAAKIMARFREREESIKKEIAKARGYAEWFVHPKLDRLAHIAWSKYKSEYESEWEKKNTRVVEGTRVIVKEISLY